MNWVKKHLVGCSRRAVKDTDKAQKRQDLLSVAGRLLLTQDFASLSMDDVAAASNVAKGTLYLYFKTKEELALGVLARDTAEWLDALTAYLQQPGTLAPANYVAWFCQSLRDRPRYVTFIPISVTILEKNISKEAAREFKLLIAAQLEKLAPLLQQRLGFVSPDRAARFLMQSHGLIMGLYPCCNPCPIVKEIIVEEKLDLFRQDFYETLADSLLTLLRGYQQEKVRA